MQRDTNCSLCTDFNVWKHRSKDSNVSIVGERYLCVVKTKMEDSIIQIDKLTIIKDLEQVHTVKKT